MQLSIIMYHYVRELRHSRFPEIKGLSTHEFRDQIAYIKRHYHVISGDDLVAAVTAGEQLPPRALLLTFDDAYLDHFSQVFPVLDREKVPACFFPPAGCVLESRVLDVNKIHFVLASVPNKTELVNHIFNSLSEHGTPFETRSEDFYWNKLAVASRYDPKEVVFIKRLLQRELPEELRRIIIDSLFYKYVTTDEVTFAKELYMSLEQIQCLHRNGMYIGSHGYAHYWLNSLSQSQQRQEIECSLKFLREIGCDVDSWMMCYPYGAYDESLLSLLREQNCKVGLTTRVGLADLEHDNPLTLPRLDTNDLPKNVQAQPNRWTLQASEAMANVAVANTSDSRQTHL